MKRVALFLQWRHFYTPPTPFTYNIIVVSMDAIERGKKPVVALLVLITSRPAILSLAAVQTKCDESFRVAAVAEVGVQSNYQRPGKHPGRRRSIPRRGRRSQGCHYDLLRLIGTLLPPLDPLSSLPASSSSSFSSMRRHTHNNKKKDKLGQQQQQHQLATLCSFCVVLHPQP